MSSVIHLDKIIVGAGLVGSSVAMHLIQYDRQRSIGLIDLDFQGVFSSSELNAGGVRATWNHPLNAKISLDSIHYYESIADKIGFHQKGYTWMYGTDQWPKAKASLEGNATMANLGVEYLDPTELMKRFPFINKKDGLGGATFSPKDGLINPNLLKLHFRESASKEGVEFFDRTWVVSIKPTADKHWELNTLRFPANLSEDQMQEIFSAVKQGAEHLPWVKDLAKEQVFRCRHLVNCSGPWAKNFARMMGLNCFVKPVRRQVSMFESKDIDLRPYGMFVDVSGVYFHPESTYVLSGFANASEPEGVNFHYDGEPFFNENIWAHLYERSTGFENLKHVTGWAGLYEVSPDHSAVLGAVADLGVMAGTVFEAHSFSGRGAMQSYAAGKGLAELIHFGEYRSIDLTPLHGKRFENGRFVSENLLI